MNITATADTGAIDVANVEKININWNGFGTPEIDLDNVSGATVTLTSTKTGYLGSADFTNVGENDVVVGAGIKRTVTVDSIEDASITASVATTLTVTNADGLITVDAGAAETVSIAGPDDIVLVATSADDINLTGGNFDTADITLGVDASLQLDGDDAVVELKATADVVATVVVAPTTISEINVSGDFDVDVDFADSSDADELTITGASRVLLSDALGAATDLTNIDVETEIVFQAAAGAFDIALLNGASVVAEAPLGNTDFQTNADLDGSADALTLTVEAIQAGAQTFDDTADQEFESVTFVIDPNSDFDTDDDFIFADIDGGTTTSFAFVSDDADVNVFVTLGESPEADASGVEGDFTYNQAAAAALTVIGAAGTTTVDTENLLAGNDFVYVGTGGDSDLTIDSTAGDVSVVDEEDGDNDIDVTALTTGDVSIETSDGDDNVDFDETTGVVVLSLGGGTNTLTLSTGADLTTADSVTVSGLDEIILAEDDTTATVSSDLLDGQSYEISTTGAGGDPTAVLNVVLAADVTSFDGSSLTINDSIAGAVLGLNISVTDDGEAYDITASEGDDTIEIDDDIDLAEVASLAGGDGDDTLTLTASSDVVDADLENVSEIETLELSAGGTVALGANALAAGIVEVVGFTTDDEIDLSDADFDYDDPLVSVTIEGGDGNDILTMSANIDVIVQGDTDSTARSAASLTATVAAADSVTFGAGVDVVYDFTDSDFIQFSTAETAVTAFIGATHATLTAGALYYASGTFDSVLNKFTIVANGTGADTLLFHTGANTTFAATTSSIVLVGVDSDAIVAAAATMFDYT